MSESSLGCAKTPAVAPHVEISLSNCICGSQIILHKRRSMPCRRIVFSTFRGCMSFYTGSVKLDRVGRGDTSIYVRCTPNSDRRFNASASVAKCQQRSWVGSYSIISPLGNAPARLAGRLSASHMTVSRAGSSGSMTRGDCPDHRRQQRDRF